MVRRTLKLIYFVYCLHVYSTHSITLAGQYSYQAMHVFGDEKLFMAILNTLMHLRNLATRLSWQQEIQRGSSFAHSCHLNTLTYINLAHMGRTKAMLNSCQPFIGPVRPLKC